MALWGFRGASGRKELSRPPASCYQQDNAVEGQDAADVGGPVDRFFLVGRNMEGAGVDDIFAFGVGKARVNEHNDTDNEQDKPEGSFHIMYLGVGANR